MELSLIIYRTGSKMSYLFTLKKLTTSSTSSQKFCLKVFDQWLYLCFIAVSNSILVLDVHIEKQQSNQIVAVWNIAG